jgi:hypothetical protein
MKRWMFLLALFDLPEAIDGTWLIVFELMTEGQKLESNFMNPEMSPLILFWITITLHNLWLWSESAVNFSMREVNLRISGHTSILSQENHGKWIHGIGISWNPMESDLWT